MEKKVRCDSCGSLWGVPQRNGERFREIRCPNCSHLLKVDFSQSEQNDSAKTVYGGQRVNQQSKSKSADPVQTRLMPKKEVTRCMLCCSGDNYPLHVGRNVIGRKAPSSDADVQIATEDKHMSRQHAIIKVARIADGSLRALISINKDRLNTFVGGQSLQVGDEVVLTSGVNVMLGNTTFIYKEEQQ